jgi:hypothetical protein
MSRAMNVNATEEEVLALCAKQGAVVSAIETLLSGGTRVVLSHPDSADVMRGVFGKKILHGVVRRAPLRTWAR